MATEPITIPVDSEAARVFREFSSVEQRELGFGLGLWLKRQTSQGPTAEDDARIFAMMDRIGARAADQGMTPEKLRSILDEK
jgi:hypothetical protein